MSELSCLSLFSGLYLYLLVVETFSRVEVINKFIIYAVIGYGESEIFVQKLIEIPSLLDVKLNSKASYLTHSMEKPHGFSENIKLPSFSPSYPVLSSRERSQSSLP